MRNYIKYFVRRLFPRPLRIHIEPFYKASLSTQTPGLTGWTSRQVQLRVRIEDKFFCSQPVQRPDVPYAFYIELPQLTTDSPVIVEVSAGRKWKEHCRFLKAKYRGNDNAETYHSFQSRLRKAVLIHAYYPEILQEFEQRFANFSGPTDFYLYIPERSPMHEAFNRGWAREPLYKKILVGESRGRDSIGFLRTMQFIISEDLIYDAVAVLQTKKSPQFPTSEGKAWRDMLAYPLLGSANQIDTALGRLFSDDRYQLAGAGDFIQHYMPEKGVGNYSRYAALCQIFHLPIRRTQFIAGTMFWIKFSRLQKHLTVDNLQAVIDRLETGATEPSFAHAWERFIGLLATVEGGMIIGCEYPAEFVKQP